MGKSRRSDVDAKPTGTSKKEDKCPQERPVKPNITRRRTAGERESRQGKKRQWILRLYVAGQTPKAVTALNNLRLICEETIAWQIPYQSD